MSSTPGCGPLICPEYVSFNCQHGQGYGCGCGNYCQPQYQMCPPAPRCGCGWNNCQQGPQGCNPMFGNLQRPAPQQQQQMGYNAPQQEQAPARSAGGAGGAAATYPDDYLR